MEKLVVETNFRKKELRMNRNKIIYLNKTHEHLSVLKIITLGFANFQFCIYYREQCCQRKNKESYACLPKKLRLSANLTFSHIA